jgi:hypothetical protein
MYNTKHTCSYMDADVFIETDDVNEQEKDFIRNCVYRQDFLYVFGLEEFKDDEVNKVLIDIYKKIHNNEHFQCVIKGIINKYEVNDEITALMLLYSFDYMYLFHQCMCDVLENQGVSNKTIDTLQDILKSIES